MEIEREGDLGGRGPNTWEERRIRWKIRRIARKKEVKGKRVRVVQGRVWIEGMWWKWDEKEDGLRDAKRKVLGEEVKRRESIEEGKRDANARQIQENVEKEGEGG